MTTLTDTGTSWTACWSDALERLELDAERAEQLIQADRMLDVDLPVWEPPQGLGPLPLDLVERAHRILDRHTEAAAALAHAARENRQHAALIDRLEVGLPERAAVYVDQGF
jgi:hypothetical protein